MLEIYGPEVEEFRALPPSPRAGEIVAVAGRLSRSIVAMNDGGRWYFHLKGTPLPFEQPEHYRARRVKDRFTIPMLRDYLAAMDIRAFDADFYAPDRMATLIELRGAERFVFQSYSLEEARAHF
jgi:hypothetical protein